jgi:hypothetical protein
MNLDTRRNIAILTPPTGRETAGDYNQNYQASRLSQPVLGCSLQPWSGFLLRLLWVWVRSQKRRWWGSKESIRGDDKQRR